ncbi:MAG: MBOAT family protein, partial [Flavobacteriales bacterium]|nr:MBOAT family protein [Flavobacteriales bacterium]
MELLLPVGISFYTFQTMSYSIDNYNEKIKPERHLGIFALFVTFFPQLVAGPIERASNLLPQFHKKQLFDYDRISNGLGLMLWGLFKKVVIADRLAIVVNEIYNNPNDYNGLTLVVGTIFFAFQIYCDFSGYSDIAIGAARVLGFDLMKNFNYPYFSKSINEFWKRWHISLSTWFRDYVYIPLGGNRRIKWRWYYNLFITFLISGLWHGANWTFIVWGIIHGTILIIETITIKKETSNNKFKNGLLMLKTFIIVCLSWVFFRANNIQDAFSILTHIFDFGSYSFTQLSLYIVPTT